MKIIAILIAFALTNMLPQVHKYRRSDWLNKYVYGANNQLSILPAWAGVTSVVLLPLMPLLLLALLMYLGASVLGSLGVFLLSILVLLYTFGPRNLDADIKTYLAAESDDERKQAIANLCGSSCNNIHLQDSENSSSDIHDDGNCSTLTGSVFQQALRRWFAIIFWFALLGVYGALAYRLIEWLSSKDLPLSEQQRRNFQTVRSVMEWPVAQLMTLGLAIAADFDSVFSAWKQYHDEQGHSLFDGDNGFLRSAACRIIITGRAGNDGFADQLENEPQSAIQLASDLIWRVLGVWLALLAILLLAGWLT